MHKEMQKDFIATTKNEYDISTTKIKKWECVIQDVIRRNL
jgi:hypothetical protein